MIKYKYLGDYGYLDFMSRALVLGLFSQYGQYIC